MALTSAMLGGIKAKGPVSFARALQDSVTQREFLVTSSRSLGFAFSQSAHISGSFASDLEVRLATTMAASYFYI